MATTTTSSSIFNHTIFAGLFFGVTTQLAGPANVVWEILSLFSIIGPMPTLWLALRDEFNKTLQACGIATAYVLIATLLFNIPYSLVTFLPQVFMVLTIARYGLLSRPTESGEEWYPSGRILAYLIGIAVLMVTVMVFLGVGTNISDEALRQLAKQMAPSGGMDDHIYYSIRTILNFYPAILSVSTLVVVLVNTGFVQKSLERRRLNIRPPGAFIQISLPNYYILCTAAVGLLFAITQDQLALNMLIPLFFGFFLVGLSLVHQLSRIYNLGTITLVVFYIFMLLFVGIAILVCLAGLLEPWLHSHIKALKKD